MLARGGPSGIFEVTAVQADAPGQPKYRVARRDGSPERVVWESQLIPAVRTQGSRSEDPTLAPATHNQPAT